MLVHEEQVLILIMLKAGCEIRTPTQTISVAILWGCEGSLNPTDVLLSLMPRKPLNGDRAPHAKWSSRDRFAPAAQCVQPARALHTGPYILMGGPPIDAKHSSRSLVSVSARKRRLRLHWRHTQGVEYIRKHAQLMSNS